MMKLPRSLTGDVSSMMVVMASAIHHHKPKRRKKGAITMATASVTESIKIQPVAIGRMVLKIFGINALIVHRFSDKVIQEIAGKQQGKAKVRTHRKPKEEFEACLYPMPGKKKAAFGFPAGGIKKCAVNAARFTQEKMTFLRGAFHVVAEPGQNNLVEIICKAGPRMVEDTVRLKNGSGDIRYRPYFDEWEMHIPIIYNSAVISPEQIVNLFQNAGFGVGLGDWRPERNGSNGTFEVTKTEGGK